ncbi:Alpha/Beta hydrolase protein [Catenaria anguillulae PL171]|uniref:Alpha/Beta hydrolase protein n=1 Tax=Catenaria anguillulae PL171 TaxID=765915 RepID=A0A1Y2HW17_9FUNG|nr:Alpha/Beta hydrolase protein [Catenaria anguillulae PL171]
MTPEPPKSPSAPPSPNGTGNKRRGNLMFLLSLLCKTIPDVAHAIVSGPERPNRPRGLDVFIRFFRAASKHKEMDVYRARSILNTLNKLGEKQKQPALSNTNFIPVSWHAQIVSDDSHSVNGHNVGVRTSLPAKYPNRCAYGTEWSVSAEWATPNDPALDIDSSKVILFLHGGAYTFSSIASYRHFVAPIAKRFRRRVFNVEYRLAPESRFPDAIHDAVSAYAYLTEVEMVDPSDITFMGDSAGGNLAMVTLLFLRDNGYPLPSGAILLSPWSDLRHNLPSYQENARFDYINPFDDSPSMNPVRLLVGDADYYPMVTSEPLLSPVLDKGDTTRPLPPIFISSGGDEILLDENILLAASLARPGVSRAVIHEIYEHQIHVFAFLSPQSRDTKRFWSRAIEFMEQLADIKPAASTNMHASKVEVVLMRNGELASRGFAETWHTRWGGIKATKALDWDPDSWPVDGSELLIAKPDTLPATADAESSEDVDEENAMLEGVVPGVAREQQHSVKDKDGKEEAKVDGNKPAVPPST